MDMSKYRDLFISEAAEHVQGMSNCILILEKEPDSEQGINELFRHAHSVKGMSASMGYSKIAELSHHLEDMMDVVRKGQVPVSSSLDSRPPRRVLKGPSLRNRPGQSAR
jgi:two-component system chemotaxis sensor kinase CheA